MLPLIYLELVESEVLFANMIPPLPDIFPPRERLWRPAVVKVDVPESVMALEIVSPLLLFVNTPLVPVVVTIDESLNARVPDEIVKKAFWPVPPLFVNEIELTEIVPMSLMVLVRLVPPNCSE